MPNPPTYDDLKRLRNQSNLKRFKIIMSPVVRAEPLTLNPFIGRNSIGVNNIDSLAADQLNAFAITILYTGGTRNNTLPVSGLNILYYPGTLNIDRTSPGNNLNLWSVNGKTIQLSDNFSYNIPSTDITVKQDFWNEVTETQSSKTLEVSTVVFDDLQYSGISASNFDPSITMYLSTNEFTSKQKATLIFSFDRSNEQTKNLFDNNTVEYHALSAYKDGEFLGEYNTDRFTPYPFKKAPEPIWSLNQNTNRPSGTIRGSLDVHFGQEFRISEVIEYEEDETPIFTGFPPVSSRNIVAEFGAFVYDEPLSAGNYEFKFKVNDRNNLNNIKESTINLNVDNFTFETQRDQSLNTIMDIVTSNPYPSGTYTHLQVLSSASYLSGGWRSDWWGFDNRDMLNFSGICWNSNAAQDIGENCPQNRSNIRATLITPRHAIAAGHYYEFNSGARPNGGVATQAWQPGDHMYFYDHTTGAPVSAIVENEYRLGTSFSGPNLENLSGSYLSSHFFTKELVTTQRPDLLSGMTYETFLPIFLSGKKMEFIEDCQLIYLDRDVTEGNDIKVYPLISDDDLLVTGSHLYPVITTGGGRRGNGRRNVGIGASKYVQSDITKYTRSYNHGYRKSFVYYVNFKTLSALSDDLPYNYTFSHFADGDSGSPTFMLVDNQLALCTHNYKGNKENIPDASGLGPNYSMKDTQDRLQGFINQIGNTEGYQLSTINAL